MDIVANSVFEKIDFDFDLLLAFDTFRTTQPVSGVDPVLPVSNQFVTTDATTDAPINVDAFKETNNDGKIDLSFDQFRTTSLGSLGDTFEADLVYDINGVTMFVDPAAPFAGSDFGFPY